MDCSWHWFTHSLNDYELLLTNINVTLTNMNHSQLGGLWHALTMFDPQNPLICLGVGHLPRGFPLLRGRSGQIGLPLKAETILKGFGWVRDSKKKRSKLVLKQFQVQKGSVGWFWNTTVGSLLIKLFGPCRHGECRWEPKGSITNSTQQVKNSGRC